MTIDTNIIIAYLAGDDVVIQALTEWRRLGHPLFLSTVVESEVLSFPNWSAEEREITGLFLEENFASIPFDRAIARIAAQLRAKTKIKFPDAAIVATALSMHTPLVTRNTRDFKAIPNLELVTI